MVKPTRTLVVGDIHGGLKCLQQALTRARFNPDKDRLICLGDYVDGWSESAEVVQFLINLQETSDIEHIYIRGNHDEWCNEWLRTGIRNNIWVQQGGAATIDSYVRTGYLTDYRHLVFFYKLHNYYIDEENRAFVHGGFTSRKGLGHDPYPSDYYWDRDLWGLALILHGREEEANNAPKYLRFRKHKEVFIGHTATPNWNCKPHLPEYGHPQQPTKNGPIYIPMNRCNVWNLDTGGGFKGKVSVMDIDTKEFWQSDFAHTLYPEESGR